MSEKVTTLTPEEEASMRQLWKCAPSVLAENAEKLMDALDASRARVRELEADLEAISATLDREGTPPGGAAERVRQLARMHGLAYISSCNDATRLRSLAAELAEALATLDRDARPANWNDGDDGPLEAAWRRGDAALAHYRAQAGGDSGWLPIESAPHGVEVLLYTPPIACMGASARHEMRVGRASWGNVVNGISNRCADGHATLWRPLPPPPASEPEGRADDL